MRHKLVAQPLASPSMLPALYALFRTFGSGIDDLSALFDLMFWYVDFTSSRFFKKTYPAFLFARSNVCLHFFKSPFTVYPQE